MNDQEKQVPLHLSYYYISQLCYIILQHTLSSERSETYGEIRTRDHLVIKTLISYQIIISTL